MYGAIIYLCELMLNCPMAPIMRKHTYLRNIWLRHCHCLEQHSEKCAIHYTKCTYIPHYFCHTFITKSDVVTTQQQIKWSRKCNFYRRSLSYRTPMWQCHKRLEAWHNQYQNAHFIADALINTSSNMLVNSSNNMTCRWTSKKTSMKVIL